MVRKHRLSSYCEGVVVAISQSVELAAIRFDYSV